MRQDMNSPINEPKDGDNGYICFFLSQRYEVWAKTPYDAQKALAEHVKNTLKFKKTVKTHEINVILATRSDGTTYIHKTSDL